MKSWEWFSRHHFVIKVHSLRNSRREFYLKHLVEILIALKFSQQVLLWSEFRKEEEDASKEHSSSDSSLTIALQLWSEVRNLFNFNYESFHRAESLNFLKQLKLIHSHCTILFWSIFRRNRNIALWDFPTKSWGVKVFDGFSIQYLSRSLLQRLLDFPIDFKSFHLKN